MPVVRFPALHARNIFSLIVSIVLMLTMGACLKSQKTGSNAVAAAPVPVINTVDRSVVETADAEAIAVAEKCDEDDEAEVADDDEADDDDDAKEDADDDADDDDAEDDDDDKKKEAKAKEKKECPVTPVDSTEAP